MRLGGQTLRVALWGPCLVLPLPRRLHGTDLFQASGRTLCLLGDSQDSELAAGHASQAYLGPQGRGTKHYGLIVVGHSLGAGTAAILSFLLRPQYPTLKCFAYSPPGGLLR